MLMAAQRNVLPSKKKESILKIFFKEFLDPMVLLLVAAIIFSIVAGEYVDAAVIAFIIVVDAIMGTYQENRANKTADSLSKLIKTKVRVLRGGEVVMVDAEDLAVGDEVMLESGDKIPADLHILEAHNLTADESILTGESLPVEKGAEDDKLFSGTIVMTGRARAVVTSIGVDTEIGKIADSLVNAKEEKSPLTIRMEKTSRQISAIILVVGILVAVLLFSKGVPHGTIFLSVIALAVSAMPEGLPLALTMALTIASNRMAKKNVVVRRLKAAESLGSCTVIASDKTGTLTVNEQTAKVILLPDGSEYKITGTGHDFSGEVVGEEPERAKKVAMLGAINNEANLEGAHPVGDSIDLAFKVLLKKFGGVEAAPKILETVPYESENKYSAVFFERDGEVYCTVKGSLEVVKGFCGDIPEAVDAQNERLAREGYRVIALACGKVKKQGKYTIYDIKNLEFSGMVGFIDPIRKEAVGSIAECKKAGIRVLMITGDHPLTAFSIGRELGLVDDYSKVASGAEVAAEIERGEERFDKFVREKTIFARVSPLQKLKIVESLKRQGEFVAVTGDGVNDAPALKVANIGVAMGSGTDIARETADMIIVDDNFCSIVAGVREGRIAYANIRKIVLFLMSCGLAEVLFFCFSILFDLPMPLVAIQLLWLNVVTDGLQDFALSFERAEGGIMDEEPRSPKESIFSRELFLEILFSGVVIAAVVSAVWVYLLRGLGLETELARGYIMALMVFIQNIHLFNCRSEKKSAFSIRFFSNKLVPFVFIGSILLQILVSEIPVFSEILKISPVPAAHLLILFLIALSVLALVEIYKLATKKSQGDFHGAPVYEVPGAPTKKSSKDDSVGAPD